MSPKPPIVDGEHVVIITQLNPYAPVGGVTVVLKNLLSAFDPQSFTIAYLGRFQVGVGRSVSQSSLRRLLPNLHPVQFLDLLFPGIKHKYAIRRAVRLVRRRKASVIIGLYPTFGSLYVATEAAKRTGARFYPYLHDTLVEGLTHTPLAGQARRLQDDAFGLACRILTMSEGMSEYYASHGLRTYPLPHSFPEKVRGEPGAARAKTAFWGGDIYAINDKSFSRVQRALETRDTEFEITTLARIEIAGANIRRRFYPSRNEYIAAVQNHGILVLALNWPDESPVHPAELSTIFPTKTIEYLASGGPILVHCPEHYFLARFFRQNGCGLVVSDREEPSLREAVARLQGNDPGIRLMQERAIASVGQFSLERVSGMLRTYLGADARDRTR